MFARLRGVARGVAGSMPATSSRTRFTLLRYLTTGGVVGLVDLATLRLLLVAHASVFVATTIAYLTSVVLHFTINKLFTFRRPGRARLPSQLRVYAAVSSICYLSTLAIVELFSHFYASPLLGKVVGILVNVPLGFYCNRRFTFAAHGEGPGDG